MSVTIQGSGIFTPSGLNVTESLGAGGINLPAGVYVLRLDLTAMQAGDTIEINHGVSTPDANGLTDTLVTYSDALTDANKNMRDIGPIVVTGPSDGYPRLKQTAGTVRNYAWELIRVN